MIARLAHEKKGEDIVLLDMSGIKTTLFDWFVIVSASSSRRLDAISTFIREALSKKKVHPIHTEGRRNPYWVLLDYGDVVVHVFHREIRDFYGLERLWSDAKMEHFRQDA